MSDGWWEFIYTLFTGRCKNFGLKLNGSVRSNRKSFENISPPFEVDHFSRLDRFDRNGPFHLTISTHSHSQTIFRLQNGGKYLSLRVIAALLSSVNSQSIGVTRTSMYSYHRCSCFASKAKGMFWLLMASSVLNERETRFASGMERDRSDLSWSIRHQEIFERQPGNFG